MSTDDLARTGKSREIERAKAELAEAEKLYANLAERRRRRDPTITPSALSEAARLVVLARKSLASR
jgi:hypothetical protein